MQGDVTFHRRGLPQGRVDGGGEDAAFALRERHGLDPGSVTWCVPEPESPSSRMAEAAQPRRQRDADAVW